MKQNHFFNSEQRNERKARFGVNLPFSKNDSNCTGVLSYLKAVFNYVSPN